MTHQLELVRAILNGPQQNAFKDEFNIDPNELTPIVTGYWKYVLLGADKAYMFHRNHECAKLAAHEKHIYQWLNKLTEIQAPLLIDSVVNKEISPYEILVVKRLQGVLLYEVIGDMTTKHLKEMCVSLSSHIAHWHEADTKDLPEFYQTAKAFPDDEEVNKDNWLHKLLNKEYFDKSLTYMVKNLNTYIPNIDSESLKVKLEKELRPLLDLKPVIVHQDLHEAQVLVSEKSPHDITGILDWESARLLNPIIEFNFNEWWKPLWLKNINDFQNIRLEMWNNYIKERALKTNIKAESILTLYNLYYSLYLEAWGSKEDNKEVFEQAKTYVLTQLEAFINEGD